MASTLNIFCWVSVAIGGLLLLSSVEGQQQRQIFAKPNENNVREIRKQLLYPYPKEDLRDKFSDGVLQIKEMFSFHIPFFGFYFNYTWVSLHGCLLFSQEASQTRFPINFPVRDWPHKADPSFIGPYYSPALIGNTDNAEANRDYPAGIYIRHYPHIGSSFDQRQVDLQEAIRRDLHDGMIGSTDFDPKHVFMVTWKNITFGGSANRKITNTYQMMLTTDEYRTYTIFNYQNLTWTSATTSNADPQTGIGGQAAFVGFNAGNGTRAYEYEPYSQSGKVLDLKNHGNVNGHPGRHVFRIDEQIIPGACIYEPKASRRLILSPESGHMLGGTLVNISGPCFSSSDRIQIKFHDKLVSCIFRSRNMAACVTPRVYTAGYVEVTVTVGSGSFLFRSKFYIENPMIATELVWFEPRNLLNQVTVPKFLLRWSRTNISYSAELDVSVKLFGYREISARPELELINTLATTKNNGEVYIETATFDTNNDGWKREFRFGMIQVSAVQVGEENSGQIVSQLWSRPVPLAWYFKPQWDRYYGEGKWAKEFCRNWEIDDARLKNFAHTVPRCPCTMEQALVDKGRFAPDFGCDKWGNTDCFGNEKILHCVRSGQPAMTGGGQQCCYGHDDNLVMNVDMKEGGIPSRSHPFGVYPYDDSTKVPGLSHWFHDMSAYYACCEWQAEMSDGCYQFKWRRASQDCIGYQPPNASVVFGDPHFVTFDNLQYTFNGKGEFALVNVHHPAHNLEVQARFEQYVDEQMAQPKLATILTALAMKDNVSSTVEVQLRPLEARWRYRLNVIVDGKYMYFDRPAQRLQSFKGVTVYTPSEILNQSHVVVMFQSGAGIEVIESDGYIAGRVYLPKSFMNLTRGLMGNWSNNPNDDLTPKGMEWEQAIPVSDDFKAVHQYFGLKWAVSDTASQNTPGERSHFHHENGRSSQTYADTNFNPEYRKKPVLFPNASMSELEIQTLCGSESDDVYQCRYDYIVTGNKILAGASKFGLDTFSKMKAEQLKTIITCGALGTPMNGRKSTNKYVVGTEVTFECSKGYVLEGEPIRWCYPSGIWSWTEYGKTRCTPEDTYYGRQAGITTGVVLGVIVPCIIGGICLFGFIISKNGTVPMRQSNNYSWRTSAPPSRNRMEMSDLQDSHEKKRRMETEA